MNVGFILFLLAPNSAFRRGAIPNLREQVSEDWAEIWKSTCAWQSRLRSRRPNHSRAVNILMRQMEWNCALYRALKDHGMSHEDAARLVESVGRSVYRPVAAAMYKFSRIRSGKRSIRVAWLLRLMTRYFFSSPFVHEHHPAQDGVSFDVTVCPLADYFKDQGLPELTPYAACNLDHAAADVFGVELHRSQTIAGGYPFCDFRWRFPEGGAPSWKEE